MKKKIVKDSFLIFELKNQTLWDFSLKNIPHREPHADPMGFCDKPIRQKTQWD